MEEKRRSSDSSLYAGKNRGPSGYLIVKRKDGGVGGTQAGSASHKVFGPKKHKKRNRSEFSDVGSGDDVFPQQRGDSDRSNGMYYEKASCRDLGKRHPITFWRGHYNSGEAIRVQGKNGVLKVMVKKKKMDDGSGSLNDLVERNASILHSLYPESRSVGKASPGAPTSPSKNGKVGDRDSDDSHTHVAQTRNVPDIDSEDSDTSLKLGMGQNKAEFRKSGEQTPGDQLPTSGSSKEAKIRRGTGTEKQKLRERIREVLLKTGWHIDYRPRRNRDYFDAVYIHPSGSAYWSIVKAYEALRKQLNEERVQEITLADGSSFMPLSDAVLSQLTRNTRKKMEKEKKKKQKVESGRDDAGETTVSKCLSVAHNLPCPEAGASHDETNVGKSLEGINETPADGRCSDASDCSED